MAKKRRHKAPRMKVITNLTMGGEADEGWVGADEIKDMWRAAAIGNCIVIIIRPERFIEMTILRGGGDEQGNLSRAWDAFANTPEGNFYVEEEGLTRDKPVCEIMDAFLAFLKRGVY